ncbi:hypothetical protein E2C01_047945 [Portunus trituberculatus]|uniref:Uncharacterized protein n=1 Tax=Portunus trituberculatus TaxID=210409 RepID=A0A5B7G8U9_PORTR|nr:hypothetical protein [Portunus trituberculatus]
MVSRLDGTRRGNAIQFWRMVHRLRGMSAGQIQLPPGERSNVAHINHVTETVQDNPNNTSPHNTIQLTRLNPRDSFTTPIEEEDVSQLLRHSPQK